MDINRAYELGATSYMVKPTDVKRVSNAIVSVGNYWVGLNTSPYDVRETPDPPT
jgi:hypothetical protein